MISVTVTEPLPDKQKNEPLASNYEALRKAALGEPIPPSERSGLALFLRRGMWGWAKTFSVKKPPRQQRNSFTAKSTSNHKQQSVIRLFAAMVTS